MKICPRLPRELWLIILKINKDRHDARWRLWKEWCGIVIRNRIPKTFYYQSIWATSPTQSLRFGRFLFERFGSPNGLGPNSVQNWKLTIPICRGKYYEIKYFGKGRITRMKHIRWRKDGLKTTTELL